MIALKTLRQSHERNSTAAASVMNNPELDAMAARVYKDEAAVIAISKLLYSHFAARLPHSLSTAI